MRCTAFLAMSLDGYIAGPGGDLTWLEVIPAPPGNDMGFGQLMESVDAVVMGRSTFDVVASFDGPWPYSKPLVVMSSTLDTVPEHAVDTELSRHSPTELCDELADRGWRKLYVDGGALVASFHTAGLLDELIVTLLPVVLGDGTKLMGGLLRPAWLTLESTETFDNGFVQLRYSLGR